MDRIWNNLLICQGKIPRQKFPAEKISLEKIHPENCPLGKNRQGQNLRTLNFFCSIFVIFLVAFLVAVREGGEEDR